MDKFSNSTFCPKCGEGHLTSKYHNHARLPELPGNTIPSSCTVAAGFKNEQGNEEHIERICGTCGYQFAQEPLL